MRCLLWILLVLTFFAVGPERGSAENLPISDSQEDPFKPWRTERDEFFCRHGGWDEILRRLEFQRFQPITRFL